MTVSILIATFGDSAWSELAWSRAYPSALGQSDDIVMYHGSSLAQARNHAAELAKGDWLCFLDADDELCPGYVAAMEREIGGIVAARPSPAILAPAVSYDGSRARIPNQGGWPRVSECVIGTLIPRRLFLELGGFREQTADGTPLSIYEDYDLFLRAWDAGARLVHVPEAVYCAHTRVGGRNVSGDAARVYDAIWREHEARVGVAA